MPDPVNGPVIAPWQVDETAGAVVSPWQVADDTGQVSTPTSQPAAPTSQSSGSKVGVSQSGFSEPTYGKVKKALGGTNAEATGVLDEYQEGQKQFGANATIANRRRKSGLSDEIDATSQMHAEEANLLDRHRDFLDTQAKLEARLHDESKIERQKYLTAAQEQLAAARQLSMMTGNPLGTMGMGSAGGMGMAQFAEGFLAARGIHLNVTSQIDKMVDRGIQQHQQQIANVRANASDQFHLYDIARQSSEDDYEARQRYRGMVIDGMKTAVQASAARFGSQIAMAQGQQKSAELDMMLNQHLEEQADRYQTKWLDTRKAIASEKIEWGKIAIDKQKIALEEKKNAAKTNGSWNKIADPFDTKLGPDGKPVTGGKIKWEIDPSAPDGVKTQAAGKVDTAKQFYSDFRQGLDRLSELRTKAQDVMKGPEAVRGAQSQEYREYKQQRDLLTELMQKHVTGAAAPDAQATRIMNWLKDDNVLESGTNKNFIDNLNENLRKSYENTMNGTIGVVKKDPNAQPEYESAVTADPDRKDTFEAKAYGEDPKSLPPGKAAKAYSEATRVDAKDDLGASNKVYGEYQSTKAGNADRRREKEDGAAERLFEMIVKPDHYADKEEGTDEIRREASAALGRLAADGHGYAHYLLGRVKDGDSVLKDFAENVEATSREPYKEANTESSAEAETRANSLNRSRVSR